MIVANRPASEELETAVNRAVGNLVRIRHRASESFVHLPNFYPSGAGATVSVAVEHTGFRISDLGFAYQEVEMIGAEASFPRRAKMIAEKYGVDIACRSFSAFASIEQLSGAISDVAAASTETANLIVSRASNRGEKEIAAHLYERLNSLFGAEKVTAMPNFKGASSREWDITALVKIDGKATAFKAVGNHAVSVYYTAAAMNDISLLSDPPHVVSVVQNIHEMGSLYNILAQAGDVIEEGASNDAFMRAVAA